MSAEEKNHQEDTTTQNGGWGAFSAFKRTPSSSSGATSNKSFSPLTKLLIFLVPALLFATFYQYSVVKGSTFFGLSLSHNVNLENSLVGHWTFDGADMSSTTVYDMSGNGNDADLNGNPLVAGKVGQALEFGDSGNDNAVNIGGAGTDFDDLSALTLSGWVKPINYSGGRGYVFSKSNGYCDVGWCMYTYVTYSQMAFVVDYSGTDLYAGVSMTSDDFNNWVHWTITWDGTSSASGVKFYRNGVEVPLASATNATGGRSGDSASGLALGGNFSDRGLNGSLDDARIYNRVLSAKEVEALYKQGEGSKISVTPPTIPALENGLIGHWTFDGADIIATAPINDDTWWVSPSTGGALSAGTLSWTNTNNILTDNASRASVTLSGTAQSDYLRGSNFGFSIPNDAIIIGIEADIDRRRSGGTTGEARDYSVRLVDDTGTLVGDNKASTTYNWPTTENATCFDAGCYGGPTDMWGTSLTPAQVNDSDFGYAIQVTGDSGGANRIAEIDLMDILIYYTIPGGAVDSSGQGNHGTISGARATAGKIGQALQFDGAANINLGTDPMASGDRTTCSWSKLESPMNDNSYQDILSSAYYALDYYFNGGDYYIIISSNAGIDTILWQWPQSPLNKWHYLCVLRPSTGLGTELWVDGEYVSSNNTGTPLTFYNLFIGSSPSGLNYFNGSIDDVRIYNRLLSDAEITQLYNLGEGTKFNVTPTTYSPLENGLVGYWTFDGPDFISNAYDRSGQGNHGYVFGAATSSIKTPGKLGQGVSFDGVDDYIRIDLYYSSVIDNLNLISTCAWIKPDSFSDSAIVAKGYIYTNWRMKLDSGQSFGFERNRESVWGRWNTDAGIIVRDKWQHVCVVTNDRSSTANDPIFYINGVAVSVTENSTPSGAVITDVATAVGIGNLDGGSLYFDGSIDDVRIYNRLLSAIEVEQIYNMGR